MFDGADALFGPDRKRPSALTHGDFVAVDGALFEIRSEAFLGMTGSSIFDVPKLFWRALVRPVRDDRQGVRYVTWAVDEDVAVYGHQNATPLRRTSVRAEGTERMSTLV